LHRVITFTHLLKNFYPARFGKGTGDSYNLLIRKTEIFRSRH